MFPATVEQFYSMYPTPGVATKKTLQKPGGGYVKKEKVDTLQASTCSLYCLYVRGPEENGLEIQCLLPTLISPEMHGSLFQVIE